MRELSLFTGGGGGIYGSRLLGWRTIGYVEINDYCQRIIAQRIKDGIFDEAPIFGDIRKFSCEGYADGYKGMVDVITAGFPCQPFSIAGKRAGGATLETCGLKPSMSFAEYDPATRCWRTYQVSLLTNTLEPFSGRWPKQGMTRDGVCLELTTLVLPTTGSGSGYWPTPMKQNREPTLEQSRSRLATYGGKRRAMYLADALNLDSQGEWFPTPTRNDAKNNGAPSQFNRNSLPLNAVVKKWPTPRASDGSHGGRVTPRKSREGGYLIEAASAATFPTPTASRRSGLQSHGVNVVSGQLNPEWVEWLMGWPIGATDLKPLAMDKFRQWLEQHGVCLEDQMFDDLRGEANVE